MSFHVGEVIGDYQIVAIIGAGSMGQVYQVEHRITKRREAIKVLSAEPATYVQIHRFEREIAVHSQLNHPNIATTHNALRVEGKLILVMEFVEGQTLENLLRRSKPRMDAGIDYIRQILSALRYAHSRGVVHRDVSPANLIVTPNGILKLTDFGVSKSFGDSQLTNLGEIIGSTGYMAPEQARGGANPDRRSDLYSVGAILYEILTGRKPFGEHRNLGALLSESEPEPALPTDVDPGLRPEWNTIVRTAMNKDRALRYQSADEFLLALESIDANPALNDADFRDVIRNGLWKAAVSIAIIALALVIGVGLAMGRFHTKATPTASIRTEPPKVVPAPLPKPEPAGPLAQPSLSAPVVADQAVSSPIPQPEPALAPEPEATATADPTVPEEQTEEPVKKGKFWKKLNPFKKRTAQTDPSSATKSALR
jgi:serine/threonine protein kinase